MRMSYVLVGRVTPTNIFVAVDLSDHCVLLSLNDSNDRTRYYYSTASTIVRNLRDFYHVFSVNKH